MLKFNTVLNGHLAGTSQKFIKFGFHCTGSLGKLKAHIILKLKLKILLKYQ